MNSGFLGWSKLRLYLLFLCLSVGGLAASGMPLQLVNLWRIAQAPGVADGAVTRLDCRNHGLVEYTFMLDGETIPGGSRFVEGTNCPTLRLGQRLNVSYQLGSPANNHAFVLAEGGEGREARAFWTSAIFLGAFASLGPLFLVFVARFFWLVRLRLGF